MKRLLIITAVVLTALFLSGYFLSERVLLERPEEKVEHYDARLREEIVRNHPIALLLTFDEPVLREWAGDSEVIASGVETVPTRRGWGRRFSGTRWSMIHTPVNWRSLSPAYTISTWVEISPPSGDQEILFSTFQHRSTGLRLEDGDLTFHIPAPGFLQTLSYPFSRWGEFVHLAAVVDPDAGRARLYENGRLMDEGSIDTVDFPDHNIEFGTIRWYASRNFFDGVIDETVIWNRALTASEIKKLYRSRRPVLALLEPTYYRRWRWASRVARGLKEYLKALDVFRFLNRRGRIFRADIPVIHLYPGGSQLRRFNRVHYQSRRSGRRTEEEAAFRDVAFVHEGRAAWGRLALDGGDLRYGTSERKGFVLDAGDHPVEGMKSIRLVPPENLNVMVPLLDARVARALNLPHTRNGLCRLTVRGRLAGLYYFEDDTRMAVSPEASPRYMLGPRSSAHWTFLFWGTEPFFLAPRGPSREGVPLSRETLLEMYDELKEEILPLLTRDPESPAGGREIRYRLRKAREETVDLWTPAEGGSPAERAADYLTPFMFLGGNPSPHYIREDLDLEAFSLPGVSKSWTSSRPDLIDPRGRVALPEGDLPERVVLTVTLSGGGETVSRDFVYRVMPAEPRLPAFMIYLNDELQKNRRVDCRVEYYPAGGRDPVRYRAFQGRGAGVKYRGTSGFWQSHIRGLENFFLRKFALSLRFEEPHRLFNETETRHLYFATGYEEASLMRNKLSYDLYRELAEPGAPRFAPEVGWAEVFINGHYRGVYEKNTRVDRHMLGIESFDPTRPDPAVLYKFGAHGDNFRVPRTGAITQKFPPRRYGPYWEPYLDLVRRVASDDPEVFKNTIEEVVDVDSVIDFHLLLNMTENRDGVNVNLYLARDAGPGKRFFIVPWDYDKTWDPERGHRWFSNALTDRLLEDGPDYGERLARRWEELRRERWSDDAVSERIDRMEHHLDGWIQWDYELWNHAYSRDIPFEEWTGSLRRRALERLHHLNGRIPRLMESD